MSGTEGVASENTDPETGAPPGVPTASSLPRTTAHAVAVAVTLGSLALLAVVPSAGVGTLAGALVGAGVWRFSGGTRELLVSSALLPVAGFGLVVGLAVLGVESEPAVVPAVIGVGTGVATVVAVTDISRGELQRVGWVGLVGAIVVAGTALLGAGLWSAGSATAFLAAGGALVDAATILVTTVAVAVIAGVLYLVPPAAVTAARADGSRLSRESILAGSLLAYVPLVFFAVASPLVRRLLFVLTLLAVVVGFTSVVVGQSWKTADRETKSIFGWIMAAEWADGEMQNPALGVILSLCGGSVLLLVVSYGAVGTAAPVPVGLGLTAVLLGVCGVVALTVGRLGDSVLFPDATTVVAGTFGLQVVAVARQLDAGVGPTVDGVVTLVVLTAALFVYTAGQYGRTVTGEVGSATARRPQLVWLGWSGVVGVVGLFVAAALYGVATTFTPVLSGPSRVGVLAGVAALAAVTWLLLDRAGQS